MSADQLRERLVQRLECPFRNRHPDRKASKQADRQAGRQADVALYAYRRSLFIDLYWSTDAHTVGNGERRFDVPSRITGDLSTSSAAKCCPTAQDHPSSVQVLRQRQQRSHQDLRAMLESWSGVQDASCRCKDYFTVTRTRPVASKNPDDFLFSRYFMSQGADLDVAEQVQDEAPRPQTVLPHHGHRRDRTR